MRHRIVRRRVRFLPLRRVLRAGRTRGPRARARRSDRARPFASRVRAKNRRTSAACRSNSSASAERAFPSDLVACRARSCASVSDFMSYATETPLVGPGCRRIDEFSGHLWTSTTDLWVSDYGYVEAVDQTAYWPTAPSTSEPQRLLARRPEPRPVGFAPGAIELRDAVAALG